MLSVAPGKFSNTLSARRWAAWLVVPCTYMLMALAGMIGPQAVTQASAADLLTIEAEETSRIVRIGLNKSIIVRLPVAARDVLVSGPKKVDAVVRSARTVYLMGLEVGQTNVFFFDKDGRQILSLDVAVERDTRVLQQTLKRLIPKSDIRIESMNDSVILTGSVASAQQSRLATDVAARFIAPSDGATNADSSFAARVINTLTIVGKDQVMLKVTVAEMQRTVLKQLGVDLDGMIEIGSTMIDFLTVNPFTLANGVLSPTNLDINTNFDGNSVGAVIRAMERNGLLRTLAEPTLTSVSGETANFLAGGEFPIPVASDDEGISIEFKPFGVGLGFTPIVLSEGRINLKVSTEVSELTTDGFTLGSASTTATISVPGLRVRRANTTVEIPSGGSLVMAGLIQESTKQQFNGIPGIKDVPVLGTLFRSRDFQSEETELVVIITPYIVEPVHRDQLATPDIQYNTATDRQGYFFGWLNKIYGVNGGAKPEGTYHGSVGFIVE
ncbi:MAG: type II and III secretion system protein family protein [Hyphomicrobiales bacterium]